MEQQYQVNHSVSFGDSFAIGGSRICNIGSLTITQQAPYALPENLSTIPRSSRSLFIGREDELSRLSQVFHRATDDQSKTKRRFVITGLGGTGKSELCLKYAEDHKEKYWGFFWIDCSSTGTAQDCFMDIGRRCGIATDMLTVKGFLSTINKRWLMIIDNADSTRQDYSQYFPSTRNGDIILTTRDPALAKYGILGSLPLQQLDTDLACQLLLSACDEEPASGPNRKAAGRIVRALGRHTLGIVLAGAYIKNCCDLQDYLELIRQEPEQLFQNSEIQEPSVYGTVHRTFEISISHIESLKQDNRIDAVDALELFNDLAFLHHEVKLRQIASRATSNASNIEEIEAHSKPEQLKLSIAHGSAIPNYYPRHESEPRLKVRWNEAVAVLKTSSLISVEGKGDDATITMHPLVHAWARNRLQLDVQRNVWLRVATVVALSCVQNSGDDWRIFTLVQNQTRACLGYQIEIEEALLKDPRIVPILWQLAYTRSLFERDRRLEGVLDLTARTLDNQTSIQKSDAYAAQSEVTALRAHCMAGRGELAEAINILESIVSSRQRDADEAYFKFPNPIIWLATAYINNHRTEKAVALVQEYSGQQLMRNPDLEADRPGWKTLMELLAVAQPKQSDVEPSFALSEPIALLIKLPRDEILARQLRDLHERGRNLIRVGESTSAVREFERIVLIRETYLAEDIPSLLTARHQLAVAYLCDNELGKAIGLLERVERGWKHNVHDNDINRFATQVFLSLAYICNNEDEKASILLENVVPLMESTLGSSHRGLLLAEQILIRVQIMRGNLDIAIERLKRLNFRTQDVKSKDDAVFLQERHLLILAQKLKGRYRSAENLRSLFYRWPDYKSAAWHPLAQVEQRWFQLFDYVKE